MSTPEEQDDEPKTIADDLAAWNEVFISKGQEKEAEEKKQGKP